MLVQRGQIGALYSSTRTVLDILQCEFPVLPMQDDRVTIAPHEMARGGEFTLRLKRLLHRSSSVLLSSADVRAAARMSSKRADFRR